MLRAAVLVLALVACNQKTEAPPPPAPIPAVHPHLPVVSNELAAQLGNFGFGLAIDFTRLDREMLANLLPATPAVMRTAVRTAKLGVVAQTGDDWRGYVTGVSEADLRECLAMFAPGLALAMNGDLAVIGTGSDAGGLSATIVDLLHLVPADAVAWAASSGLPKIEAKTLVGWLETSPATWTFTIRVEAKDEATARTIIAELVAGLTGALGHDNAIHVDRAWFKTSSTRPGAATLVATVPLAALAPR